MQVPKRDFLKCTNKYLKEGTIVLTMYGKEALVLTISKPNVRTTPKETEKVRTTEVTNVKPVLSAGLPDKPKDTLNATKSTNKFTPNYMRNNSKYSCGCKKGDSVMCSKHGRL